ncbi:hypothetical protein IWT5_02335 [Secundilactobacillus silagincola]|uniref:Uncharacterized protein n=1 Tax=Secundilactobacillus silagincola TaxID=1714681 RepID=A0A1Z5J5G9_9LACO|nr:hypothetical protein IWT5_02335 [Secundilactobacillus silagincola]
MVQSAGQVVTNHQHHQGKTVLRFGLKDLVTNRFSKKN